MGLHYSKITAKLVGIEEQDCREDSRLKQIFATGTYVRLQPETSDFQKAAGDATEDTLVSALSKRSALSEGDRLSVEIGDVTYWLRVQQLKPKPHVSVIGTPLIFISFVCKHWTADLQLASLCDSKEADPDPDSTTKGDRTSCMCIVVHPQIPQAKHCEGRILYIADSA